MRSDGCDIGRLPQVFLQSLGDARLTELRTKVADLALKLYRAQKPLKSLGFQVSLYGTPTKPKAS